MGLKNLLSQAILDLELEHVQITSEFYQYTSSHPFVSIETISENKKILSKQFECEKRMLFLKFCKRNMEDFNE